MTELTKIIHTGWACDIQSCTERVPSPASIQNPLNYWDAKRLSQKTAEIDGWVFIKGTRQLFQYCPTHGPGALDRQAKRAHAAHARERRYQTALAAATHPDGAR